MQVACAASHNFKFYNSSFDIGQAAIRMFSRLIFAPCHVAFDTLGEGLARFLDHFSFAQHIVGGVLLIVGSAVAVFMVLFFIVYVRPSLGTQSSHGFVAVARSNAIMPRAAPLRFAPHPSHRLLSMRTPAKLALTKVAIDPINQTNSSASLSVSNGVGNADTGILDTEYKEPADVMDECAFSELFNKAASLGRANIVCQLYQLLRTRIERCSRTGSAVGARMSSSGLTDFNLERRVLKLDDRHFGPLLQALLFIQTPSISGSINTVQHAGTCSADQLEIMLRRVWRALGCRLLDRSRICMLLPVWPASHWRQVCILLKASTVQDSEYLPENEMKAEPTYAQ